VRVQSSAESARIEVPIGVGCWEELSPSPLGKGSGKGLCPSTSISIFELKKGEFWCILRLIKPTFDRRGVSIFWPAAVCRGRSPLALCGSAPAIRMHETNRKLNGCIVWDAHNTVFGSKSSVICAQAVYFLHLTRPSVTRLNSR